MKLIIEIDEKDYNLAYDLINDVYPTSYKARIYKAIANGTPYDPTGNLTEAEKKICKMYLEDLDKTHTCNEYKLLMSLIDNAPTVKPQRPKGKWLKSGKGKTTFFCSECGREIDTKPFTRPDNFPFCHCGADMRNGNKFQDLVVFDDQPKRQLEDPDCHNEL